MTVPVVLPYDDFGGEGPPAHFAHANGYPPRSYRNLLQGLATDYHVVAMHMRPLWPETRPEDISDWRPLADDLARFFDQQNLSRVFGWGHSMGATTTLRLALRQPERFSSLVLIDPVIFPPLITRLWDLIYRLGLGYRLHPLVRSALKRRSQFDSHTAMYATYRQKAVFQRMGDAALEDYVKALGRPRPDGVVDLYYPPSWEARVYATGVRADIELWHELPKLKVPLLIIRGAKTSTFWKSTGRHIQRCLPTIQIHTVPEATHLVALERPEEILAIARDCMRA
jgi:pimeloyl-ACP methyl ester carboxylesterase